MSSSSHTNPLTGVRYYIYSLYGVFALHGFTLIIGFTPEYITSSVSPIANMLFGLFSIFCYFKATSLNRDASFHDNRIDTNDAKRANHLLLIQVLSWFVLPVLTVILYRPPLEGNDPLLAMRITLLIVFLLKGFILFHFIRSVIRSGFWMKANRWLLLVNCLNAIVLFLLVGSMPMPESAADGGGAFAQANKTNLVMSYGIIITAAELACLFAMRRQLETIVEGNGDFQESDTVTSSEADQ